MLDEIINESVIIFTLGDRVIQVYVPWKRGSNNPSPEQPITCIDSFIRRTQYNHVKTNGIINSELMFVKTLSRTRSLIQIGIHYSFHDRAHDSQEITSDGLPINQGKS